MSIINQVFSPISFRNVGSVKSLQAGLFKGFGSFGIPITKAAKQVNTASALSIGAFYNAVDLCSNDIAKLPKAVFRKEGDTRTKLTDHQVQKLIAVEPNGYQTPFSFWKILAFSAIVKGDGFARIHRNPRTGDSVKLEYLDLSLIHI